jgi:signal transduction histidine kinase
MSRRLGCRAGPGPPLALGIADFTILSLVAAAGTPVWATVLIGVALVGGPLLVGLLPAARQVEGVAVQTLLVVEFRDGLPGPAAGWPQRGRTLGWFLLHVFTGALVVGAVLGLIALRGSWWTVPAAVATAGGTLLAGRFLAWLGPMLLGPSYAERLQRLEADAARATERNRIAREIHDSVGHALSVVTVQASAARKLIGRDPVFTAEALATIEEASRRAATELDGMLRLLRDETPRAGRHPGLRERLHPLSHVRYLRLSPGPGRSRSRSPQGQRMWSCAPRSGTSPGWPAPAPAGRSRPPGCPGHRR